MRKLAIITGAMALAVSAAVAAGNTKPAKPSNNFEGIDKLEKPFNDSLVKRGEYLVSIMGCDDCHSPKIMGKFGPEPDLARRLSGHPAAQKLPQVNTEVLKSWVLFDMGQTAAVGPWGVSYAANITSDQTGIGSWTEAQFFTAIRKGKFKGLEGSRPLLPPMPWAQYAKVTDDDVRAIFAYLKTTPPVQNVVPEAVPPTAFK